MIRRLVMARALLCQPPRKPSSTSRQPPSTQSRHQVWESWSIRKGGLSILLTTHNMDEASRLCDRLIIVDQAFLVEGKPPSLVRRHIGRDVIEVAAPKARPS